MNAEDIIWGGDTKLAFSIRNELNIHEGSFVKIKYDEINNSYFMETFRTNIISTIIIAPRDETIFENLFKNKNGIEYYIIRVLKYEELKVIVQVKIFYKRIVLTELQSLSIAINDTIINKLPERAKINPIQFLYNEFVFEDEESNQEIAFTKSYKGRIDADFSLLSKRWILNIKQVDNSYVAKSIIPLSRNRSGEDFLAVIDGHLFFENNTASANVNKEFLKQINNISTDSEYFATWESYDNLEQLILLNNAQEKGFIHYTDVKCELKDSYYYYFSIKEDQNFNFSTEDIIAFTDDEKICNLKDFKSLENVKALKSHELGKFSGFHNGKIEVVDDYSSHKKDLPKTGYLFLSLSGDSVRIERRKDAKNRIAKHETPIGLLAELIDGKANTELKPKNIIGLTKSIEKKLKREFNEEQRDAIEMAMQTPDIGLILGPPGTGKTTVIKAIISRYEEYYRLNNKKNPRILVSSFQHEAVENVIIGIEENGLPSNRKGGKRGEDKRSESIKEWRSKTNEELDITINKMKGDFDLSKNPIIDEVFAWNKKGKSEEEGIKILHMVADSYKSLLSLNTQNDLDEFILSCLQKCNDINDIDNQSDELQDKVISLLNVLPSDEHDYNDLTRKEIRRFKTYIEHQMIDYDGDISFFDEIFTSEGKDKKAFNKYLQLLNEIKNKYQKREEKSTQIEDSHNYKLEELLNRIVEEIKIYELNKPENLDVRISRIISDYKEKLSDEMEVNRIVQKYSTISAATCQQALEVGRDAEKEPLYDLVIIDEAARANPLDLFIPMSMGKTVILVGDYLQLPHMLDPFVVKKIEKENKNEKLPILKESLFEKLYKQFDEQYKKRELGCRRTIQLVHQYRMNRILGNFANEAFYKPKNYKLDSENVNNDEKQCLIDLYGNKPAVWLDVNKKLGIEQGKISKYRFSECKEIISSIKDIFKMDPTKQIGVITFYKAQSDKISDELKISLSETQCQNVSVGTVDAFQGKEFDIVFLSCVRANNGINQTNKEDIEIRKKYLGHITDVSRLCVSLTRAKQMLVVVGDSETMKYVPELELFLKLCQSQDGYYEQITE